MKKLTSIHYSAGLFNFGMLILRLTFGVLMIKHGYDKLIHFDEMKLKFFDFLHLGMSTSLCLTIFAELFCALFLVLGLFTRLAVVPLIICMGVALFQVHNTDVFGDGQEATLYLTAYLMILFTGPGRISVDGLISK